ncbi:eif2B (nucleomorph) [Hemiselmis andersenii]|uniref:Eif2B n=1 Tax=Hemiselmis andersenii TaxID=464988 RepID=A9BKD4_HEMAN|nr:eif2B [Hemiselmis andersenii]ABW97967.1 eif2B [Hemiselmis andersenii]|mmetsp:Transcript_12156/g.28415  ORF Transcript_12156/g.28415 Transcript_12156/m.28415 type:complete len:190 (+) Transcript_12156:1973-2542(+)
MLIQDSIFEKSLKNFKKEQNFYKKKELKKNDFLTIYNYEELLDRFIKRLEESTVSNQKVQRLTLEPPKLGRDGTKKTIFLNFEKICKKLGREKEHLFFYISTELGTTASIQDSGALVLKGKFQPKGFENILRNYIKEYVLCGSCQSSCTILEKDTETRLIFLRCNRCQAWRSVNQIRPGFIAQTKKKRV